MAGSRFAYLALLMDLYSRRIVGWELDGHMTEALVLAALRGAIRRRQLSPGLIHHTDRGGQYAGDEYRQVLQRARMEQSMSRPDNCYDNAFMESCFGTLKTELAMEVYADARAAQEQVREYLCYYDLASPMRPLLVTTLSLKLLPGRRHIHLRISTHRCPEFSSHSRHRASRIRASTCDLP
jgi:putative transposase